MLYAASEISDSSARAAAMEYAEKAKEEAKKEAKEAREEDERKAKEEKAEAERLAKEAEAETLIEQFKSELESADENRRQVLKMLLDTQIALLASLRGTGQGPSGWFRIHGKFDMARSSTVFRRLLWSRLSAGTRPRGTVGRDGSCIKIDLYTQSRDAVLDAIAECAGHPDILPEGKTGDDVVNCLSRVPCEDPANHADFWMYQAEIGSPASTSPPKLKRGSEVWNEIPRLSKKPRSSNSSVSTQDAHVLYRWSKDPNSDGAHCKHYAPLCKLLGLVISDPKEIKLELKRLCGDDIVLPLNEGTQHRPMDNSLIYFAWRWHLDRGQTMLALRPIVLRALEFEPQGAEVPIASSLKIVFHRALLLRKYLNYILAMTDENEAIPYEAFKSEWVVASTADRSECWDGNRAQNG